MKAVLRRLDTWQRSHAWIGFPFGVLKKFGEDQAGNLAALVAYYAFFSIFPLLLAFSTILGFVLAGHPAWQHDVTSSALKNLPLIGNNQPPPLHGSVVGLVVGLALALWSGLGVAKTAQTAFNTVYLVAHTDRPNFLTSTLNALYLVVVGGVGLIVTTIVSGGVTSAGSLGFHLGIVGRVVGVVLTVALNTALFLLLFRWLTVRHVKWRDALPGAVFAAVAFEVLQLASTAIITHKLKGAQTTYGNFGTVVVMLSWFYLQAQAVLLAVEINVVRQYRLWPRALSDPPATEADFRTYEAYAERERYRPEEDVDTAFSGQENPVDDPTGDQSTGNRSSGNRGSGNRSSGEPAARRGERDAATRTPAEERRAAAAAGGASDRGGADGDAARDEAAGAKHGDDRSGDPEAIRVRTITTVDPYPFEAAGEDSNGNRSGLLRRLFRH